MKLEFKIFLFFICFKTFGDCSRFDIDMATRNARICELLKPITEIPCKSFKTEVIIQLDGYSRIVKDKFNVLKIICHQSHSLKLDKLPFLDLSEVKSLEVVGCSMKNQTILSEVKNRLNLVNILNLVLQIDSEKSKSISNDLFKDFQSVENLKLFTAKRDEFQNNSFSGLQSLENFELSVYDLTTVPSNLFATLSNVINLKIVSTAVRTSWDTKNLTLSFRGCTLLNTLSIAGIRNPIRMNLKLDRLITEIEIKNNKLIKNLVLETFKLAEDVEYINLSNNSINVLNPEVLGHQKGLVVVDLSRNQIDSIQSSFFVHNTELIEVDLSYNLIKFIEKNSFFNQKYLKKLNLNSNNLNTINIESFFNTEFLPLEYLFLQANNIARIDGQIPLKNNLILIDLRNNNLSKIFVEEFWPKSKNDLTILLENNLLETIDVRYLTNLRNAFENQLTIELGETPIICNCYTISLLQLLTMNQSLQLPEFVYQNLRIYPENPNCKETSISSPENVKSIDPQEMLCPLDSPHTKVCNSNCQCNRQWGDNSDGTLIIECINIENIPRLPDYKELSRDIPLNKIHLLVSKNLIKNLPKRSNANYNDVTKIDASHNLISRLTEQNIPINLKFLNVKDNKLNFIIKDVLTKLSNLETVYLSGNPWNCTSPYSKNLIKFVKTNRQIVKDFEQIQCSNGKHFLEFEDDDFCNAYIFSAVILTFFIFAIIILLFLYYRNKVKISEWIFLHDKYHLLEKLIDYFKPLDACILFAPQDQTFADYIGSKLVQNPNSFKCCKIRKTWNSNEKISEKIIPVLRKSRRIIIILSEYFNENNWKQWSYGNIYSRNVFITKGSIQTNDIRIKNKITIKFSDPLFWDKLKHSLVYRKEMIVDSVNVEELETFVQV